MEVDACRHRLVVGRQPEPAVLLGLAPRLERELTGAAGPEHLECEERRPDGRGGAAQPGARRILRAEPDGGQGALVALVGTPDQKELEGIGDESARCARDLSRGPVQRLPACEQRHPAADVGERVAGLGGGRTSDARFDLVQGGVDLRRTDEGEQDEAAQRRPDRGVGRAGEPFARDLFGGLDLPGDGQGPGTFDGDAVGVDRVLADPRGSDREQFGRL